MIDLLFNQILQTYIYAMRRFDSIRWAIIESMNAYQKNTDSPYEWIKEQTLQLARTKLHIDFRFISLKPT